MTKMLTIATIVTGGAIFIAYLISHKGAYRKRESRVEGDQYECGIEVIEEKKGIETQERLYIKFYYIAIIFLVFDIEIVLIVPMTAIEITRIAYITILAFMAILVGGLIYEYRKDII